MCAKPEMWGVSGLTRACCQRRERPPIDASLMGDTLRKRPVRDLRPGMMAPATPDPQRPSRRAFTLKRSIVRAELTEMEVTPVAPEQEESS
jgi:hypothetical protein